MYFTGQIFAPAITEVNAVRLYYLFKIENCINLGTLDLGLVKYKTAFCG